MRSSCCKVVQIQDRYRLCEESVLCRGLDPVVISVILIGLKVEWLH